jgi:membrane protein DedA with SNARE-associated domain
MRELILAAMSQYGSPALFAAVTVAAVGVPLPVTLMLVVAGSLVAQGVMGFHAVILLASAGSVIGDQIGYAIGRWGGTALVGRLTAVLGGARRLEQAEAKARHWGGPGVFFSRWLVSPLGPWINFASGIAGYSWVRFVVWDVLGEVLGAVLYVALGRVFSDRVLALDAVMGNVTWTAVALVVAVALGWRLLKRRG